MDSSVDRENQAERLLDEANLAYQKIQPLVEEGQKDLALSAMVRLAEKYPDFAVAQNDLGVLYHQKGEKEKAFRHYQRAAELNPENTTFQKNMAEFYLLEQGDVEKSLSIYTRLLSADPQDIEILTAIGHICLSLQKLDDAAVFFNKILDIEPWNQMAWKAIETITAGDSQPVPPPGETPESLYQKAQESSSAGKVDEAIQILKELLIRFPEFAPAFNDLGVLYYRRGDKTKALGNYQKAAQYAPQNATFQKNLADYYYVEMGEIEKALELYLACLRAEPSDLEVLFAIGHICKGLEKFEDARLFYNRVLDIEPWNLEAQEQLDSLPPRTSS